MDAEIIYDNGERFKLSDLSVKVIDFKVSSMSKQSVYEDIEGANRVDYGAEYKHRTISIPFVMTAYDLHDFAHLRNEIFAKVDSLESLYIREMRRPKREQYTFVDFNEKPKYIEGTDNQYVDGKQYRVRLRDVIEIEQRGVKGDGVLVFETTESPYAQSVYTTLELHDSGYSATAEKYGLVDNIDDEKVKYRFTPDLVHTELTSNLFEQGSIFSTNGQNADSNTQFRRLKNHYSVTEGQNYQLNLSGTGGTINYIRIFHYDASGNHISNERSLDVYGNGDTSLSFVALGTSIRLLIYANGSAQVNVGGIGTLTKISLSSVSSKSEFNVYNAGNVTVEPESSQLYIQMNNVTSDGNLKMTNKTTGETFEYYRSVNRRHIALNGMVMTENGSNQFRNSNRRFISLAPGDNEIEITSGTFDEINFDFKYLYK